MKYLEISGLTGYERSQVVNLSGGQQQRVALARSMATLQTGSPQDIYFRPQSMAVSSFIGRANFIDIDGKPELIRPENIKIISDDNGRLQNNG